MNMDVKDERQNRPFEKVRASGIIAKIKGIKNIQIIVAILIIAVALIIYSNVLGNKNSSANVSTSASVMTDEEMRLASVLKTIDGAGDVSVMITKSGETVVGVIVIAEGAKDISVRLRLLDATATALGIEKSIVNVYSKSG